AVDGRAQGRLRRHRPQAGGHAHLFAHFFAACLPGGLGGGGLEEEVGVVQGAQLDGGGGLLVGLLGESEQDRGQRHSERTERGQAKRGQAKHGQGPRGRVGVIGES